MVSMDMADLSSAQTIFRPAIPVRESFDARTIQQSNLDSLPGS
jgi:hypothetical protein